MLASALAPPAALQPVNRHSNAPATFKACWPQTQAASDTFGGTHACNLPCLTHLALPCLSLHTHACLCTLRVHTHAPLACCSQATDDSLQGGLTTTMEDLKQLLLGTLLWSPITFMQV